MNPDIKTWNKANEPKRPDHSSFVETAHRLEGISTAEAHHNSVPDTVDDQLKTMFAVQTQTSGPLYWQLSGRFVFRHQWHAVENDLILMKDE